jgi:hypothetical protein
MLQENKPSFHVISLFNYKSLPVFTRHQIRWRPAFSTKLDFKTPEGCPPFRGEEITDSWLVLPVD